MKMYKNGRKPCKAIIAVIAVLVVAMLGIFLCACGESKSEENQLLRLHIRAQSNSAADQAVKLLVRDKVVLYLESELASVTDFAAAKRGIAGRKKEIKQIADEVLAENGFDYRSNVEVQNEYFPTRMYEELVVESGYYDALIINLGDGSGDNWWCVVYPPLCFLEAEGTGDFRYKSKIKEIIDKYFGK